MCVCVDSQLWRAKRIRLHVHRLQILSGKVRAVSMSLANLAHALRCIICDVYQLAKDQSKDKWSGSFAGHFPFSNLDERFFEAHSKGLQLEYKTVAYSIVPLNEVKCMLCSDK